MPPGGRSAARSVADGSRFIQNAKSRADSTRFAQNVRSPPAAGNGETPQQRVARLREAARRERMNQITTFDRVVHRGRIWADNLHRATVFTIMGFSAVTIGITIYSVAGMMSYSRHNRTEYMGEIIKERDRQRAEWRLGEIQQLIDTGLDRDIATKLFDEAEETRRKSQTVLGRLKTWAYGGLTPAEETYMSRYELQEDRIHKQVYARLQQEFYDQRGMVLPKKESDYDDEELLEGVAADAAAVDGILPTVTSQDVKEGAMETVEKVKTESKGYWGSIRSFLTSGRA